MDPYINNRNRSFNEGADARLAGLPITDVPYPSKFPIQRRFWQQGWLDVEFNWPAWKKPLPAVGKAVVA
jgi:hypothetical protein